MIYRLSLTKKKLRRANAINCRNRRWLLSK